jgi:hypothetical protein
MEKPQSKFIEQIPRFSGNNRWRLLAVCMIILSLTIWAHNSVASAAIFSDTANLPPKMNQSPDGTPTPTGVNQLISPGIYDGGKGTNGIVLGGIILLLIVIIGTLNAVRPRKK